MNTKNAVLLSILKAIHKLIHCAEYVAKSKTKDSYFSRPSRCKLSFQQLIIFLLQAAKKSIQVELSLYISEVNPMCNTYSKQAFSKRRRCIKWEAIQELFLTATKEFYKTAQYKTFHGFVLAAIDGSRINLPDSDELKSVYGEQITSGSGQNQALASCAFDVLNEFYLDALLMPCKSSERELAKQHIENIKTYGFKKTLYIFDRGYPSADLIKEILRQKSSFLFRCDKTFVKGMRLSGNDCTLEYRFKREKENFHLRIVRFALNESTEEILVSNIPESEISFEEMKALYHKRWGIESSYNCAKNTIQLENFSGISEIAIKQDFYASLFLYNLTSVNIFEQQEDFDLEHNSKDNKFQYKQNRATTIGRLKPEVTKMLLAKFPPVRTARLAYIAIQVRQCTTRIDPDRQFQRQKKHLSIKYPINSRSVL